MAERTTEEAVSGDKREREGEGAGGAVASQSLKRPQVCRPAGKALAGWYATLYNRGSGRALISAQSNLAAAPGSALGRGVNVVDTRS